MANRFAPALDDTNPLDYSGFGFGTAAETPEYYRNAARLLSPVEQEALVLALAMSPHAGVDLSDEERNELAALTAILKRRIEGR